MFNFPIPILANAEIGAEWAIGSLGVGVLIFIYIMARVLLEYQKNR